MRAVAVLAMALACHCLAGCGATKYQNEGWTGGFSESEVSPGTWQMTFAGNGFTSQETVQTYWLYRAADFTLQKGYDGFRVGSSLRLTGFAPPPSKSGLVPAQIYSPEPEFKPTISGRITLLKKPFKADPPQVFDAALLKARLEPLVNSLCGSNVCPHLHDYLMPELMHPVHRGEI